MRVSPLPWHARRCVGTPKLLSWFITSAQANGIWFSEVLPSPWMARIMGSRSTRGFVARATLAALPITLLQSALAVWARWLRWRHTARHSPGRCVEIAFRFGKPFAEETGTEREGCGRCPN